MSGTAGRTAALLSTRALGAGSAALLLAALAAFAAFVALLLTKDPVVWPDEALFANPAVNLIRHGQLGTDLMAGTLPGIETRTYWMPPLHALVLAPLFAAFGIGVVPMRLLSAACALCALALTYGAGRRAGLTRPAAAVATALLAFDPLFQRAARFGRMDALAIALGLAALFVALAPQAARPRRWPPLLAGGLAALAALAHPLGAIAGAAVGLYFLLSPPAPRRALLPWLALGAAIPLAGWGLYILEDPSAFVAQFGAQLQRKASRDLSSLAFLAHSLALAFDQYGAAAWAARPVWAAGTLGLALLAVRRGPARLLLLAHAVAAVVVLPSQEIWYPAYLAPTLALGLGALAGASIEWLPLRRLLALPAAGLVLAFGYAAVAHELALVEKWRRAGAAADYATFCAEVGRAIPPGARVFVAVFPDLYLCLAPRADLSFRSFVPAQLPVPAQLQQQVVDSADVIVTGRWAPAGPANAAARTRGRLLGEVGPRRGDGYHALVYAMPENGERR